MKFTVQTDDLLKELAILQRIVPTKPALPALSGIFVTSSDNTLTFYATDTTLGLRTSCKATIDDEGSIILPSSFIGIAQTVQSSQITVETSTSGVHITAGRFKSRLSSWPVTDFPKQPEIPPEATVHIASDTLTYCLQNVLIWLTNETGPKNLYNCAKFIIRSNVVAFIGTNGKALAVIGAETKETTDIDELLPKPALTELLALLDAVHDPVGYARTANLHVFYLPDNRVLISRVVQGQFAAYEGILQKNKNNDKVILFDRAMFLYAVRLVMKTSDSKLPSILFTFTNKLATLESRHAELGDCHEVLDVGYEGEKCNVILNGAYLEDFLKTSNAQLVKLELKDEESPAQLRPLDTGFDHICVMSPLRV